MDPVGATLRVLGLVGLFTACTDCLECVQLGRAYAADYELLQTKFEAERMRFLLWGEAFGFTRSSGYDTRLNHPTVRPTVGRILHNVQRLFDANQGMTKRYGLRIDNETGQTPGLVIFAESYRRFQARIRRTQRQTDLGTKMKCAISDKRKFSQLVQDLRELIDSLYDISSSLKLLQQNDDLLAAEIKSLSNPASLQLLKQALINNEWLSDTASRRLRLLEKNPTSISTNARTAEISSVDSSSHTAPSQQRSNTSDTQYTTFSQLDEDWNLNTPQNQRIVQDFRKLRVEPGNEYSQVSIDGRRIGTSLQRLKAMDVAHTKNVINRLDATAGSDQKRIILILERLLQSKPTSFVSLTPIQDNLMQLLGRIEGPPGSPYESGIFHVQISISEDFPFSPPHCRFLTKIYHPNIDYEGKICLDFLEPQNWTMELMNLEGVLLSICALLDQPNADDPLVPEIAATYLRDRLEFNENAKQFTLKYANEHVAIKPFPTEASKASLPSWKSIFLENRLQVMHARSAALIKLLEQGPATTNDPEMPTIPAKQISSCVKLLYELSLYLSSLKTVTEGSSAISKLDPSRFEDAENFFDACAMSYLGLGKDPVWRENFPWLKTLGNNTTRGTGAPYLPRFLNEDQNNGSKSPSQPRIGSASDLVADAISGYSEAVKRLEKLIQFAKWLNGDPSLVREGSIDERVPGGMYDRPIQFNN